MANVSFSFRQDSVSMDESFVLLSGLKDGKPIFVLGSYDNVQEELYELFNVNEADYDGVLENEPGAAVFPDEDDTKNYWVVSPVIEGQISLYGVTLT